MLCCKEKLEPLAICLSREILVFLALSDRAYVSGAQCVGLVLL